MNPYLAKKAPAPVGMSRIDLLLALYDGAIERLDTAHKMLRAENAAAATPLLGRTQLIISELAAGVRLDIDEEMGTNYLRLYEFVLHLIAEASINSVADAAKIMRTLREGFASIRDEAVAMERRGEFASSDRLMTLSTIA